MKALNLPMQVKNVYHSGFRSATKAQQDRAKLLDNLSMQMFQHDTCQGLAYFVRGCWYEMRLLGRAGLTLLQQTLRDIWATCAAL